MCSSMPMMPPLPPEFSCHSTSYGGDSFSYSSSGYHVTSVLDPKAQAEKELQRVLDKGLRRTARARETMMDCIMGPMRMLLTFWGVCIVALILIAVWKNGGFKWLF